MQLDDIDKAALVQFKLQGELHNMMFNPHLPEGIVLHLGEPEIEVRLSGVSEPISYQVQGAFNCSIQQFEFVRELIGRRYILIEGSPLSLPHFVRGEEKIAADGLITAGYGLRQHHLPPEIRALITSARAHLEGQLSRIVQMFRWAQNVDAPHNAFDVGRGWLLWKTDLTRQEFHLVPLKSNAQVARSPIGIRWGEGDRLLMGSLLNSDAEEPLAHEMLCEGIALSRNAPRSALLALASALEIGVKQHVANVAPNTAWLMEEMPAPPIYKVLKRYIPILHADHTNIRWDGLRVLHNGAQDLSEKRNKLAHAGTMPMDINVEHYVSIVKDWLYFLDFLRGHEWAADHVSYETRQSLGWPQPTYDTFLIRVLPEE